MTDRCQIQGKLESQYHQVVKFCCEFLIRYGRLTLIFKLDKKIALFLPERAHRMISQAVC